LLTDLANLPSKVTNPNWLAELERENVGTGRERQQTPGELKHEQAQAARRRERKLASGSAPAARASASLPTFAFVALAAVLADAVGARYDSAGDDSLHGAPGFRATLGLHRNFPPATTQRIGDAVGIGEGYAGQGQEQGGGKSQFFHSS
jgi:hypothetical protein